MRGSRSTESDVEYFPVRDDVGDILVSLRPDRLLTIGTSVPLAMSSCLECRILGVGDVRLPMGSYVFRLEGETWVLHVQEGATPLLPYRTSWAEADDAMVQPYGWLISWWPEALEVRPPLFAIGDDVQLVPSGQEGTVRKITSVGRNWSYEVRVPGRTVTVNQDGLSPFVVDTDPADWVVRSPAPAERFAAKTENGVPAFSSRSKAAQACSCSGALTDGRSEPSWTSKKCRTSASLEV